MRNRNSANHSRFRVVKPEGFGRVHLRGLPAETQEPVSAYVRLRQRKTPRKQLMHVFSGGDLERLRLLDHHSKEFQEGVAAARESVAGKLALMAKKNTSLFDFLHSRKYVLINGSGKVVGTNFGRLLGIIGRARVATKDILWLMNHL